MFARGNSDLAVSAADFPASEVLEGNDGFTGLSPPDSVGAFLSGGGAGILAMGFELSLKFLAY